MNVDHIIIPLKKRWNIFSQTAHLSHLYKGNEHVPHTMPHYISERYYFMTYMLTIWTIMVRYTFFITYLWTIWTLMCTTWTFCRKDKHFHGILWVGIEGTYFSTMWTILVRYMSMKFLFLCVTFFMDCATFSEELLFH